MALPIIKSTYFANIEWLDETVLDQLLYCFRPLYEAYRDMNYLFIPIDAVDSWKELYSSPTKTKTSNGYSWDGRVKTSLRTYNLDTDGVRSGYFDKAFTVIYMGHHWGVVVINFRERSLAFGDSLHQQTPMETIRAIQLWLRKTFPERELKKWDFTAAVMTLYVGRQRDGGSCGIHALEAIEFAINRVCSCSNEDIRSGICTAWAGNSALALRLRYLNFVIGYSMDPYPVSRCTNARATATFELDEESSIFDHNEEELLLDVRPNKSKVVQDTLDFNNLTTELSSPSEHNLSLPFKHDLSLMPSINYDGMTTPINNDIDSPSFDQHPQDGGASNEDSRLTDPGSWTPAKSDLFKDRDTAYKCLKLWAKHQGFILSTFRSSLAEGTVTYKCHRGGAPRSRKSDDPSLHSKKGPSQCCNCPFAINLCSSCGNDPYKITKVNLQHEGHKLDLTMSLYTTLDQAMLDQIRESAQPSDPIERTMAGHQHRYRWANFDRDAVSAQLKSFRRALHATAPGELSQSTVLLTLLMKEPRTLDSQDGWYYESEIQNNTLTKIFWMSPLQRLLYKQYHDVVVYDTTQLTNRLRMPLHCFVKV
ncbi:hypothetical protein BGZ82_001757 [Podila clonocystis]|nr:hypothetical protein BGZ82_001757 [Podila clonocystis]